MAENPRSPALQTVLRPVGLKGFVVLPKRWVVERTFAWLARYRRHSKDYERTTESSEAMIYIAMMRHIMGIGDWDEKKTFDWRRIQDNLCKIRPETIERINHLIVAEGHRLEPEAAETVRADSFVAETNIHYPTEGSLIRDGLRKILQSCAALAKLLNHDGWRQRKHLYKKTRKLSRNIDRIAVRKGRDRKQRLNIAYQALLEFSGDLVSRAYDLQEVAAKQARADLQILALNQELKVFLQRTEQVRCTARRRVLEEEQVPNKEKLFSIFETHTQLYKRGKAGQPVQFGRLAMVYEDAAGFISLVSQVEDLQTLVDPQQTEVRFDLILKRPDRFQLKVALWKFQLAAFASGSQRRHDRFDGLQVACSARGRKGNVSSPLWHDHDDGQPSRGGGSRRR